MFASKMMKKLTILAKQRQRKYFIDISTKVINDLENKPSIQEAIMTENQMTPATYWKDVAAWGVATELLGYAICMARPDYDYTHQQALAIAFPYAYLSALAIPTAQGLLKRSGWGKASSHFCGWALGVSYAMWASDPIEYEFKYAYAEINAAQHKTQTMSPQPMTDNFNLNLQDTLLNQPQRMLLPTARLKP